MQWSKWSGMALFLVGVTLFAVRGDTPMCFPDLISKYLRQHWTLQTTTDIRPFGLGSLYQKEFENFLWHLKAISCLQQF